MFHYWMYGKLCLCVLVKCTEWTSNTVWTGLDESCGHTAAVSHVYILRNLCCYKQVFVLCRLSKATTG